MRRGGIRQRLDAAEAEEARAESQLAQFLVTSWAWGEMTPQNVQMIAQLAVKDVVESLRIGRVPRELLMLASLGSFGAHANNCHRDLVAKLEEPKLCEASSLDLPLKLKSGTTTRKQRAFWPHEVFASIFRDYPDSWQTRICPGQEAVTAFWEQMSGSEVYATHPVRLRATHRSHAVPISIHGDGVPVTGRGKKWCKFADIFSWTSMLAYGPTIDIMFFIWMSIASLASKTPGQHTQRSFFAQLAWSLNALWEGKWPAADHTGRRYRQGSMEAKRANTPLADGYFGVLWCLKGDLDYFASTLELQRYSSLCPCCFCEANSADLPWTDFRPDVAPWLDRVWTAADWLAQHPNRSPLFNVVGSSILTVHPDYMHCKHLGTDQQTFGSVLWLLCYEFAGEPEKLLEEAFALITKYYRDHKVSTRFTSIRLSMFTCAKQPRASPPKLKGKAAEIRNLGPALQAAWDARMDFQDLRHQQVRLLLQRGNRLEEILNEHPDAHALPGDVAADFLKVTHELLAIQTALNAHFVSQGLQLFHITVKAHYLLHCAMLAGVVNPRMSWCYCGEDFMQKMRTLVGSCCKGSQPSQIIVKVAVKYRRAMHQQLSGKSWKLK